MVFMRRRRRIFRSVGIRFIQCDCFGIICRDEMYGVQSPKVNSMKRVVSNMAGVVLEFLVKPGERIEADQDVVMLESMKMQIPVQTTVSGTVKGMKVKEGDFVDEGDVLLEVE